MQHYNAASTAYRVKFLHRMPSSFIEDVQEVLLLGKDLPPLDMDFDSLSLPRWWQARLLKHCCDQVLAIMKLNNRHQILAG